MTSLTFLTVIAVDPITRTKKEVLVDQTPLTNEWTDRCVRSGHLAVTLHSQSSRKKRRDWSWKCKHRSKWRISIIVMEFFGDPIVPDGKISGTARSSYGTAGYVRNIDLVSGHINCCGYVPDRANGFAVWASTHFPSSVHNLYRACTNIGWARENFCRTCKLSDPRARRSCKLNA